MEVNITTTTRKVDGEYRVTLRVNGKIEGTYFTNDKKDAADTERAMRAEAVQRHSVGT